MKRPRVLLVDDMPEVVRYCAGLLETEFEIVGTAASGPAAVDAVTATSPDVIVLDISMPGLNGIEVSRRLRREGCQTPIVFFSADDALSEAALDAGGSAYVSKSLVDSHLRMAISAALEGKCVVALCGDEIDRGDSPGRRR